MTKKIYFHTLLLLATHISSFCAINNNKPKPQPAKIIATIAIKDALSILPITNNRIAISYPGGCSIWDYSTNKEIFQLIQHKEHSHLHHITLNDNRTKLALFYMSPITSIESHLSIYSTSTGGLIWKARIINNSLKIPVFSATDDNAILLEALACNPTKEEYITHRGSCHTLSTREELFNLNGFFSSAKYSPSGKIIVLCNIDGSCDILDTQSKEINHLIKEPKFKYDKTDAMDFDPTGHILAIIPPLSKSIEYWNAETWTLIAISELPEQYSRIKSSPTSYNRITFSSSGKEIIIAMKNQCLVLQVPFELIYDMEDTYIPDTTKKCLSLLSILNQFISIPIPLDIKYLLIYCFLKISKVR